MGNHIVCRQCCTLASVFLFIFSLLLGFLKQFWKSRIEKFQILTEKVIAGTNRTGLKQVLTGLKGANGQWSACVSFQSVSWHSWVWGCYLWPCRPLCVSMSSSTSGDGPFQAEVRFKVAHFLKLNDTFSAFTRTTANSKNLNVFFTHTGANTCRVQDEDR